MPYHTHEYYGVTSYDSGHTHDFSGRTSEAPTGIPHIHYLEGYTTREDGHHHYYRLATGPDIPSPFGGHSHMIYGPTEVAHGHIHIMRDITSID